MADDDVWDVGKRVVSLARPLLMKPVSLLSIERASVPGGVVCMIVVCEQMQRGRELLEGRGVRGVVWCVVFPSLVVRRLDVGWCVVLY